MGSENTHQPITHILIVTLMFVNPTHGDFWAPTAPRSPNLQCLFLSKQKSLCKRLDVPGTGLPDVLEIRRRLAAARSGTGSGLRRAVFERVYALGERTRAVPAQTGACANWACACVDRAYFHCSDQGNLLSSVRKMFVEAEVDALGVPESYL